MSAFLRRRWLRLAAISAALLVPCFWHSNLEAGDLGSHVYNAWLAQLVEAGRAPGLYFAPQSTNMLFDWLLLRLGSLMGLYAAERIAVSLAVLIFFWGAFALAAATARRAPWSIAPVLAMLAYGYAFEMGFFNFYLSLGLSFCALALFAGCSGRARLFALPFAPLAWLAHPLGFLWMLAAAAYLLVAESLSPKRRYLLVALAAAAALAARFWLVARYPVAWPKLPLYLLNGSDQLVLFAPVYRLIAIALALFALGFVLLDRLSPGAEDLGVALPLYLAVESALLLLPDSIWPPLSATPPALVVARSSLLAAVAASCVLARLRPRKLHLTAFSALAAAFFALLYLDTGRVSALEDQARELVAGLPPNSRISATLYPWPGSRIFIHHIVDRACIGRCFSYENYEPSSLQFRLRARPGNEMVTASAADSNAMMSGRYAVKDEELPLYQIARCPRAPGLCLRELHRGERQ